MKISERINFWRKFAQTVAEPAPTTEVGMAPTITISQIPTFRANLFEKKPEFTQDIQDIINLINKYLFMLSGGKLDFSATWKSPSIGPSQFTSGLKNMFSLSKWIYDVVSVNGEAYSIDGLKKLMKDLNSTVSKMDFPEPKASTFKSEIISIVQVVSNKLGS